MPLVLSTATDPGDADWDPAGTVDVVSAPTADGPIPVDASASVLIVTGAGDLNLTVAAPSFAGQELLLFMQTDGGGNAIVTFAAAVNVANDTIATFANVNESLYCKAFATSAAGLQWRAFAPALDAVPALT